MRENQFPVSAWPSGTVYLFLKIASHQKNFLVAVNGNFSERTFI